MNDTAIKNFCIWARRELIAQVAIQAQRFGIRPDGYEPATIDVVEGRLLNAQEKRQRAELLERFKGVSSEDYQAVYEKLIDEAAYIWFNRMIAIRYMELNDRLPAHVRVLSADDGSFRPQVIREALDVQIDGLDPERISALIDRADDEALFRYLFLAQCQELSACLPDVFEPVGAAMELLLPEQLLRSGSVIDHLVTDIPEADWLNGVEIVGWMYQYYVSERKDEVFAAFKKGAKADASALAPATQLFTPEWIVQYLTQNSLGRLWVQTHPQTQLPDEMPYYIPDEEAGEATLDQISPEDISVIDPACGSGHILVYAFRLLAAMYEEAGYSRRDIPRLILKNNLTGLEIDPRAAALASFALSMTACEWDSRFLRREDKPNPNIVCLKPVDFSDGELSDLPLLAARKQLLDAMTHMDLCGSLFVPDVADFAALESAEGELAAREAAGDVFAHGLLEKVQTMLNNCKPLAQTYDCVIANPPYMGSKNMDKWLSDWTKKHYPDSYRDLCTCFIERGFSLSKKDGYSAMITMQSWMFLGSFEDLRNKIIGQHTITSMAHLGTRAFGAIAGEVVSTTATVYCNNLTNIQASYLRLVDFEGESPKEQATLEAISDPDCGWFYRRSADAFKSIPGTPIAYWASDAIIRAFADGKPLKDIGVPRQGLATGENEKFVRMWWEVCSSARIVDSSDLQTFWREGGKWAPYNKGGEYRKWYGNNDLVLSFSRRSYETLSNQGNHLPSKKYYFKPSITWSAVSSGSIAFRYKLAGHVFDTKGSSIFAAQEKLLYLQGLCNSTTIQNIADILSPTLDFSVGQIAIYPIIESDECKKTVLDLVQELRELSKSDWDSFETSWDFRRSPLI